MRQQKFIEIKQPQWTQLECILDYLEADKKRQKEMEQPSNIEQFPVLYRSLCDAISLAQDRHYSHQLTSQLNSLALRCHNQLYKTKRNFLHGLQDFLAKDFPQLIRQNAKLFWLASALFYGPTILFFVLVSQSPEFVYQLFPSETVYEFEQMYDPAGEHYARPRGVETDVMMFAHYINNNISIAFRTFASGLIWCVGTLFILVYNGIYIGGVAGHLNNMEYGSTFWPFVIGHGAFELTAIVIAGVAGIKLGWVLVSPGRYTRSEALRRAGKICAKLIVGAFVMLVIAAALEAFWSSSRAISSSVKYTVGTLFWLAVGYYFLFSGRRGESR